LSPPGSGPRKIDTGAEPDPSADPFGVTSDRSEQSNASLNDGSATDVTQILMKISVRGRWPVHRTVTGVVPPTATGTGFTDSSTPPAAPTGALPHQIDPTTSSAAPIQRTGRDRVDGRWGTGPRWRTDMNRSRRRAVLDLTDR
jgi:hypothetical protein